ncbi:Similar to chp: Chaoptin (Drosophila melanogaster) [Cotesia congregata]|uniref:Similar to chp: Chaoptin (Drosophila melanogaster) n=1 Tax=Cotesia congregata TaxID=51543 RepID=A0A8J2HRW7_COTCN|nr:Similar to chp: Chaoptin (Drosophila melanogaster) [Cotesia congregata]
MFQFSLFLRILCLSLVQGQVFLPDMEIVTSSVSNCQEIVASNNDNTALDLSQAGIVRLRKSFINSSSITHIYLNDNNIWKVEDGAFDGLPNLVHVDLTGNLINFSELIFGDKIETLILDQAIRNDEHSFSIFDFNYESCQASGFRKRSSSSSNVIELTSDSKFENLKELHLRKNNIESIVLKNVDYLGKIMPKIIRLYLDDNKLTSLDFAKPFTPSLTHLYLNNNKMSEFKSSSLFNLRFLTVDGNNIKNLCGGYQYCVGMSLQGAENLEFFSISNNGLEEIEADAFKDLNSLKHLNLSYNYIIKIVKHAFDDLEALIQLNLDHNKLMNFPDICGLKNLEILSLQSNKIKAIGKISFCGLSNITKLNLSNNLISELDAEAFNSLLALKVLDLSGNMLEALPDDWISPELNLQYLYLNDNFFKSVASLSLSKNTVLEYLFISGNPFKSINLKDFPGNTINVNLMGNDILEIESKAFKGLPHLVYLNLSHNKIPFGKFDFAYQSALETLVLDHGFAYSNWENDNKIQLSKSTIFPKLKNLYLCGNHIINFILLSDVVALSEVMPNIAHLYLSENSLSSLNFLDKIPQTLTHLYLENNKISHFESSNKNNIKVLSIDKNGFKQLSDTKVTNGGLCLKNFVKLEELSVSNSDISTISLHAFDDSQNLQYLNLSYNKFSDFLNNPFNSLKNLTTLDLDHNLLRVVPNICALKKLQVLSLSSNKISFLSSSSFCGLPNLKKLTLSNNGLRTIGSDTFNNMFALEKLDLSKNMLTALPQNWIPAKMNLQYLYVNDNKFVQFSNLSLDSAKNLNSLITHLYLTDNNIWKIDEGAFDYLPNLVYLNLTGNLFPLEELNFGGESSIETLILDRAINQHNNLEYYGSNDDCSRVRNYRDQSLNVQNLFTLSISVKLPKLKKLYLRQNNIQSIDLGMGPPLTEIMPNVTHIYLSENSIDSIRFIDYLPATLTHLFLDYNLATNFEVESLKNLKTLTLDGNQIGRLCNSYEYCLGLTLKTAVNLENLSVSKSGLQEIESDAFDNLQNLKKLDVSGNQLHKIVKHTFDNLTNLTTLKLDDNQLVTLPDICSLENLEHLSVANNKIRAISKSTFCGLSKLKVLNLSGNALQEISVGAFDELVALEELDLSKNAFVSLPDEWLSPELSLRRLHLNNNMFKNLASLSLSKSKNLQYINIGDNPLTLIDIKILTTLPENTTANIVTAKEAETINEYF